MDDRAADLWPILFYIVLPSLVAAASLACLKLSDETRTSIVLSLVGVGIGLGLAEAYLIVFHGPVSRIDLRLEAAEAWGYPDDDRAIIDVIEDLQSRGEVARPPFILNPALEENTAGEFRTLLGWDRELLPLAGVANVRTIACNEIGYWLDYISDQHGFRNPPGLWKSDAVDLVLLGDSFTFGNCVPEEHHFAGVLRQRYSSTLNLGYPAIGPITAYATLTEYAKPLRPRKVLWFFFEGNDVLNLRFETSFPQLLKYLDGEYSQDLLARQPEIDAEIIDLFARVRPSAHRGGRTSLGQKLTKLPLLREVRKTLNIASFAQANRPGKKSDGLEHAELLEEVLARAKSDIAGWGGELYVVYLPAWRRGRDVDNVDEYLARIHTTVTSIVQRLEIPFIDTTPVFMAHPDPTRLNGYPRGGGHYSKIGYQLVGRTVLEHLDSATGKVQAR